MDDDDSLRVHRLSWIGTAVLAAALPVGAAEPRWSLEHREWAEALDGIRRVDVVNEWGDVRVRGGEGVDARVAAAVQQAEGDPAKLESRFERSGEVLTVVFAFSRGETGGREPQRRVDLGVALPGTIELSVRTVGGEIEVRDLDGAVKLRSVTGAIDFAGRGALAATSRSGDVRAQFRDTRSAAARSRIETVNGAVRLELLAGAQARVELETTGTITTDVSIEIDREPNGTRKRARTAVGDGAAISVHSEHGALRLVSLLVEESSQWAE